MTQITIELDDTEILAFSTVAIAQEWIENAAKERARIAIDDIVNITVQQCLAQGMQIPSTKADMVTLAFEQGWVKTL